MNQTLDDRLGSLRRAVGLGMANGKGNLIVDLDLLVELFTRLADTEAERDRLKRAQEGEAG